jgi:hypothetical protein
LVTTDKPIKQAPYHVPAYKNVVIEEKINEVKERGVLEDSKSPFSSSIVLAKKKNGDWRFCVNYRALNDITVKDAYPLTRINDTLQALHGNSYFSIMDLLSGFWQTPLRKEDRHKTACVSRTGLYQITVMPFGLTNAPATFQRLMDRVLSGLNWLICVVYIYYIIVFGRTLEEHNKNLDMVLTEIEKANLKINPLKCVFAKDEVTYLGHRIGKNGVVPDLAKVEAINRIAIPTDSVKVGRFLRVCSYYRRFVKHFNLIALHSSDCIVSRVPNINSNGQMSNNSRSMS